MERSAETQVSLLHATEDGRALARDLIEQPGRAAMPGWHPRQHLPPVEPDKLLCQVERVELQLLRRVVSPLNRQLCQRKQKCKLVGRHEATLRQKPLGLEEELNLLLRVWMGHRELGFK